MNLFWFERMNFSCKAYQCLLLLFVLSSLVLPIYTRQYRSNPSKKAVKKKPKPSKLEEYSDNTSSLSSAESFEIPANYTQIKELFENVRQELLFHTAEGREPNTLRPPRSRKTLIATLKRDLIDDLMTKMVIKLSDEDPDKISYLINDEYHVNAINTDCYKRTRKAFSDICINIEKNAYMNRFMNIFANACDAKWLPGGKINACFIKICKGINRSIADAAFR